MLNKVLSIFSLNTTPPPQKSSLNTQLEPSLEQSSSLFGFIFSRFIYVFSFGLLHAIFLAYAMPEQIVFQKEVEYILLPSLLLASILFLISPYNRYLEIFFYFYTNIWSTISIFQAVNFQTRFDVPSMYIMLNTTKTEATGFLTYFINFKILLILGIIWFIPYLLFQLCKKYSYVPSKKIRLVPILLSLILLLYPSYTHRTLFEQIHAGVFFKLSNIDKNIRKSFWVENSIFFFRANQIQIFASSIPENVYAKYEGAQNVVLFITESTNRNQLSIYGYPRDTTPKLKHTDIIVYDDVISPSPITYHSLPLMLTFADLKKPDNYTTTIHDLFKAAGFDTYGYNGYSEINKNDFVYILQTRAENFKLGDERVDISVVEDALEVMKNNKDKKNFILIFTAAMHFPYNTFYPKEHEEFTDTPPNLYETASIDKRNHYDSLVKYMDSVITDFLSEVDKIGNTVVLFTSDHGEEVGNFSTVYGHSHKSNYLSNFEIPFYVYLTDDYNINKELVFDTNRKYQNDNLLHSIIDLANIETEFFNPQRSIFNKDFVPTQRFMHEEDYETIRAQYKNNAN